MLEKINRKGKKEREKKINKVTRKERRRNDGRGRRK
jgi:hypothetical protein